MKNSFVELNARERAIALLNSDTAKEIVGPFDGIMSPHLLPQGIVPQSDDGVVIMQGTIGDYSAVVISLEGAFQGGGIGEVNGAKIAGSLEQVLKDNQKGKKVYPIIIFDTGGVRLQEANYGLLSISEIQNMIIALRTFVPVIGIVPGLVGSFGGMSITAALASYLITTNLARVGLNGPEVVEQEAGVREFDSSDKMLIWDTIGVNQKAKTGLVDEVVEDNIETIIGRIESVIQNPPTDFRSRKMDQFLSLFNTIDFNESITPQQYAELFAKHNTSDVAIELAKEGQEPQSAGRGYTWFSKLTGIQNPTTNISSVIAADVEQDGELRRYLAVVPDKNNRFYRVQKGEVGLQEGMILAKYIWQAIEEDKDKAHKRPLILVIDVPSQAYGYKEELMGIHLALACSVDAYATARQAGHPVIGLIVGNAISGAFLAHGLQSNRLIALNDSAINVQAMSKESAARVTLRTIEELEKATEKVPAMAYDINNFQKLGALYQLVNGINADNPSDDDVNQLLEEVRKTLKSLPTTERQFEFRYTNPQAIEFGRIATNLVRNRLDQTWQ